MGYATWCLSKWHRLNVEHLNLVNGPNGESSVINERQAVLEGFRVEGTKIADLLSGGRKGRKGRVGLGRGREGGREGGRREGGRETEKGREGWDGGG